MTCPSWKEYLHKFPSICKKIIFWWILVHSNVFLKTSLGLYSQKLIKYFLVEACSVNRLLQHFLQKRLCTAKDDFVLVKRHVTATSFLKSSKSHINNYKNCTTDLTTTYLGQLVSHS